jgi:hypothetical protein
VALVDLLAATSALLQPVSKFVGVSFTIHMGWHYDSGFSGVTGFTKLALNVVTV